MTRRFSRVRYYMTNEVTCRSVGHRSWNGDYLVRFSFLSFTHPEEISAAFPQTVDIKGVLWYYVITNHRVLRLHYERSVMCPMDPIEYRTVF